MYNEELCSSLSEVNYLRSAIENENEIGKIMVEILTDFFNIYAVAIST